MGNIKVSVCITTLNEEDTVSELIDSLLNQSKVPDEIIIIDGGSTDNTLKIIRHWQKKNKLIKCIVEEGSVAHGRNTAIELSENSIVAMTDAGCVTKPNWLENLTNPFKYETVGMVAGFYDMPVEKPLQKAMSVFLGVPPQKFDNLTYLPSTRSVAFRKEVWEKVGGFNEKLKKAGEDSLFFYNCVKSGVKIARVKEARVVWREINKISFGEFLSKLFRYAEGDVKTGIWWHPVKHFESHNIKVLFIFIRYFLGLVVLMFAFFNNWLFAYWLIGLFVYLFWSVWKWRYIVRNWKARLLLPVVQVSSDIAVMSGFLSGIFNY